MAALVVKFRTKSNNKMFSELVKKLGGNVVVIDDEQYEDLVFGAMIEKAKTGKSVGRETIMKTLRKS